MTFLKSLAIAALGFASSSSLAADFSSNKEFQDRGRRAGQFVLQFHDRSFHGNNTLMLKRELQRQYGINAHNLKLQQVMLVAKTRHGRGTAMLRVDHAYSHAYTVMGRPHDFHSRNPRTFDRVNIYRPSRSSNGPWQIELNGHFKVRKVVLVTSRKGGHGRGHGDRRGGGYGRGHGHRMQISCASLFDLPMNCQVDGYIRNARLVRQHSDARCIQGRTWGYNGNSIWVDGGCRGTFEVSTH